jgi:hypothetical protein
VYHPGRKEMDVQLAEITARAREFAVGLDDTATQAGEHCMGRSTRLGVCGLLAGLVRASTVTLSQPAAARLHASCWRG